MFARCYLIQLTSCTLLIVNSLLIDFHFVIIELGPSVLSLSGSLIDMPIYAWR